MRILVLGFSKMKYMPYASFYIDRIDCNINEVEVLYWNRDRKEENLNRYDSRIRFHEFSDYMQDSAPYARKLFHFYRYRSQALKLLKTGGFDFVIVLHTLPGILVSDYLLKNFAGRYIFDYRDSSFEHISFFGKRVMQLSLASKLTFVSSDAFRRFLPSSGVPVITSHNILEDSLNHRDDRMHAFKASPKIRIAFWGFIRHADHNKKIIDRLGKDSRFELHYYGRKQAVAKQLETYAKTNGADNVFFHGEYNPEDRYRFACCTDIIHNSYWDNNTRFAMGNKYYDSVIFRIPQLTMPGTYMGERCTAKGTGIALDPASTDYADSIWQWFGNIDRAQFENCCDTDLDAILKEYNSGKELLNNFFNRIINK